MVTIFTYLCNTWQVISEDMLQKTKRLQLRIHQYSCLLDPELLGSGSFYLLEHRAEVAFALISDELGDFPDPHLWMLTEKGFALVDAEGVDVFEGTAFDGSLEEHAEVLR